MWPVLNNRYIGHVGLCIICVAFLATSTLLFKNIKQYLENILRIIYMGYFFCYIIYVCDLQYDVPFFLDRRRCSRYNKYASPKKLRAKPLHNCLLIVGCSYNNLFVF